jgi:MraZ protein
MFQGEYEHSLDEKNRVVLPSGLRKNFPEDKLKEGFSLVIGRKGRCLELHPMDEWRSWIERLHASYSDDNEEADEYLRDILASAYEIEIDKKYRFVIPEARKKEAGLETEVVFVGVFKRIEIWDRRRWEERKKERMGKQAPPPMERRE